MRSVGPSPPVGDDSVANIPAGDPWQHGSATRDSVITASRSTSPLLLIICRCGYLSVDMSTNRRQGFFCRCTTSMEQAADRAETAAVDHYLLSPAENIFVPVCLWTSGNILVIVLWYSLGLQQGAQPAIQIPHLQLRSLTRCRLFAYGPADATAIPKPHYLLWMPGILTSVIWILSTGSVCCESFHWDRWIM